MKEKPHAIRNDDESIWIDFDGEIPKVGHIVSLELAPKWLEIDESLKSKEWIVYKVLWFFSEWRIEPHPSMNHDVKMISQARVYIKENTDK